MSLGILIFKPVRAPIEVANIGPKNHAKGKLSISATKALGIEIYSRVDVLLSDEQIPYVLEVNTIPGMTETSLLPKAANAYGINFADLCERIAELSMRLRKKY